MKALVGGLAGACALTLLHETVRRFVPEAPRMDILGMRAISKTMEELGETPPQDEQELHRWALTGDIVSNAIYYSFAGTGKDALWRGTLLGAAAGAGALYLPGPLGLGEAPSNRTPETQAMTVGYYLLGGIIAGAIGSLIGNE